MWQQGSWGTGSWEQDWYQRGQLQHKRNAPSAQEAKAKTIAARRFNADARDA
jgi:hypothetical protein